MEKTDKGIGTIISKKEMNGEKKEAKKLPITPGNWYTTFMYMHIPVFGFIYLFILSRSKTQPLKREFARAYLLYKITILTTCIVLIIVGIFMVFPYVEKLLNYMELL